MAEPSDSTAQGAAEPGVTEKGVTQEGVTAQGISAQDIRAHMEVRSSDGLHVGTVDHMEGDTLIKLTRSDPAAHGRHHLLPLSWVERVDEHVHLTATAADVRGYWEDAG
jgi:hypothetical protein